MVSACPLLTPASILLSNQGSLVNFGDHWSGDPSDLRSPRHSVYDNVSRRLLFASMGKMR